MPELSWGDWNTDTAASTNISIDGDTFTLAPEVPDSGNLQAHYDWSGEDGSTPVSDQSGNGFDLSGSYSGVGGSINGIQAGVFDGTNDFLSNSDFPAQSRPNTIYIVFQHDGDGFTGMVDHNNSTSSHLIQNADGNLIRAFNGSPLTHSAGQDTNPHHMGAQFTGDSADDLIGVDGSEEAGDAGARSHAGGIAVGNQGAESGSYYNGVIGEILWYNVGHDSTTRQDVYDYFDSKWGFA